MKALTVLRYDVFTRVRTGDRGAVREVVGAIDRGVRLLLARRMQGLSLKGAISDVHKRVLLAITDCTIIAPEELAAFARNIIKLQAPMRTTLAAAPVNPMSVTNLQEAMSAEDLEVLHRYYVLGQSTDRISKIMGISSTAIESAKQRARRAQRKPAVEELPEIVPNCLVA